MTERAHYHLSIWGEWRRTNRGAVGRGYPSRSAGIACECGSSDLDALVEREDSRSAAICDAAIYGLPEILRHSLEGEYIMQGVFKHRRMDHDALLRTAIAAFWDKARRHLA